MNDTLHMLRDFFIRPNVLFAKIAVEQNLKQGILVFLAVTALVYVPSLLLQNENVNQPPLLLSLIMLLFSLVVAILPFLFITGFYHLIASVCGGTGKYKAFATSFLWLNTTQLASIPFVLPLLFFPDTLANMVTAPFVFTPVFIYLLGVSILMTVWCIALLVMAIRKCYCLSYLKAMLVTLSPLFLLLIFYFTILLIQ